MSRNIIPWAIINLNILLEYLTLNSRERFNTENVYGKYLWTKIGWKRMGYCIYCVQNNITNWTQTKFTRKRKVKLLLVTLKSYLNYVTAETEIANLSSTQTTIFFILYRAFVSVPNTTNTIAKIQMKDTSIYIAVHVKKYKKVSHFHKKLPFILKLCQRGIHNRI